MKLRIALLTVLSLTVSFSLRAMEPKPSEGKLTELPPEMIHEIAHYLTGKDLLSLRAASRGMREIVQTIRKPIFLQGETADLRQKLEVIATRQCPFHMMIELEVRDTQDNITQFIQEVAHNPNLANRIQYLYLSNNQLQTLPAEIGQLTNLQELNLYGNQLTILPEEIGQLTNLQKLGLWHNQLQTLPSEIVQLTNLQTLDLSLNKLTILPKEIGQLTNLQKLCLVNNQLQTLPAEIGQLTNLQTLDLLGNQLQTLPAEIGQLTNLQQLYLWNNQLLEEERNNIRSLLPNTDIHF